MNSLSHHQNRTRSSSPRFFSALLALGTLLGIGVAGLAASPESVAGVPRFGFRLVEPQPLEPKIVAMMQTNVLGPIESRIYFAVNWDLTRGEKAQVLFTMFAQAEPDDQRKLAHAAVPYVANANFGLVAKPLLNPKLPRTVLSVLMTDTLKRDYSVKLPMILSLAQQESHPLQSEARELLQGYLGRNHGTNWVLWEQTIEARLQASARK